MPEKRFWVLKFFCVKKNVKHWHKMQECKVLFTVICIVIVYILLVNKVIYKWPNLYIKT